MVPEITIPLDDSPRRRWQLSAEHAQWAHELIQAGVEELGEAGVHRLALKLYAALYVKRQYRKEIQGIAEQAGVSYVAALAGNLYYDFVKLILGCTAFALNTPNGPVHARNLDWFSHGDALAAFTTISNFVRDDGVRFRAIGWPGGVGVLSAIVPGRFTVTLNAVLSDEPSRIAESVALLIRDVCQNAATFGEAVDALSTRRITSDCLLLVTGIQHGEMVVIERTPTRHALRTTDRDFIVVTNDYRVLDCDAAQDSGEIYQTACNRYDAATARLSSTLPQSFEQCFDVLDDEQIRMQMTVQQMVMCARTDTLAVRTAQSA